MATLLEDLRAALLSIPNATYTADQVLLEHGEDGAERLLKWYGASDRELPDVVTLKEKTQAAPTDEVALYAVPIPQVGRQPDFTRAYKIRGGVA